jgi:hypothetical protein
MRKDQVGRQETVEEAAERVYPFVWNQAQYITKLERLAFIKGYEERQKGLPEEDLIKAFEGGHDSARKKGSYKSDGTYAEDLKIWLTEFKNKLCQ